MPRALFCPDVPGPDVVGLGGPALLARVQSKIET